MFQIILLALVLFFSGLLPSVLAGFGDIFGNLFGTVGG